MTAKVWLVQESAGYEGPIDLGIFSTEELAQQYIDRIKAKYPNRYNMPETGPPALAYPAISKTEVELDKGEEDLE